MTWLILLLLLMVWIGVGYGLLLFFSRTPPMGTRPLVRSVARRVYLVGDHVQVNLACSNNGLAQINTQHESIPWDIVLAIDHSGSMGSGSGSTLEEAKQTAINLVRTTPRSFRFAVVEFDDDARELCPLAQRGRGLERALKSIGQGSGTDIALGLKIAGQCLQSERTASERKHAIILLSDGGSVNAPALEEKQALLEQDPETVLITIGLGSIEMGLLRKLASNPDYCYQTNQLDSLQELYEQIGRKMAGQQACNVQVGDRFNTDGAWGLRAWGEIEPAQRAIQQGRLTWLLATLEFEPIELAYSLEALCPGWHPVASGPAELRMQLDDADLAPTKSNRGPRVLVLPQVIGWQLLSLILNPLFFLLFGRWFRGTHNVEPSRQVDVPQLRPLELPEPIVPPPVSTPLEQGPSLLISLGFGGAHTLVHCKRLVWERGRRADMNKLRFLAIDTASEEFFPNPEVGRVSLTTQEHLRLSQPLEQRLSDAVESPSQTNAWLPARRLLAGAARPDLQRGTGHQRALGRLAMISSRSTLEDRLRVPLQELLSQGDASGIDILITGTSSGGTASGGILELCWLLRRLLAELGGAASISLFLLAPLAREEPLAIDGREKLVRLQNANALMRELDRVAAMRGELVAPMPSEEPARNWFDRVFCIGPAETNDPDLCSAQTVLYPKGGEALFSWLASEDFRSHFKALQVENSRLTQNSGKCFVHRLDPDVCFLYPSTVGRYVVVESLRRRLAERLWDIQQGGPATYSWRDHRPSEASSVRDQWLQSARWAGDFPWVFLNMEILREPGRLQEALLLGAGPRVSANIPPLERDEYFREQQSLVRTLLDVWVVETLNGEIVDGMDAHALITVLQVLKEMGQRLADSAAHARQLEEHSELELVRVEAEFVAELTSLAATEICRMTTHLERWDTALGEGIDAGSTGLMRYLDLRAGELHTELDRLMNPGLGPRRAYSRLPMTWDGVDALQDRASDKEILHLLERLRWDIRRDGVNLDLELHLQGTKAEVWTLDGVASEQQVSILAASLIQTGLQLLPRNEWRLDELMDSAWHDKRPKLVGPRGINLNPGARAIVLTLGESLFELPAHVESKTLVPIDAQESRVVACEENLSTQYLWPYDGDAALPFVFSEEFHAYRAYGTYCHEQGLLMELLPPSLVGLCRDPDALLAFTLVGLAENHIRTKAESGQQWWVADLERGSFNLSECEEDALTDFLSAANAWIAQDEPGFWDMQGKTYNSLEDLKRQVRDHKLLVDLPHQFGDRFISLILGLAMVRGCFDL